MKPRCQIYIPTKGRHESRLTVKALEAMGVPYKVVIEEQEYTKYASVIKKSRILVRDESYVETYNACCDLEPEQSKGSGPSRNFIWDHSVAKGHDYHWTMDDNIKHFFRFNRNLKVPVNDGTIFRCMEDWVRRYKTIAMAGPQYFMFVNRKAKLPPFVANTRIYSCNLIRNDVPFRWRGRYNEDTDLSLRMLKAGWCTVLFNSFLQMKTTTQYMKGGNTDEIYVDGTLEKSQMIVDLHPDVARLTRKFGRIHHHVDYRPFRKNKLVLREGVKIKKGVDNYGMKLVKTGKKAKRQK